MTTTRRFGALGLAALALVGLVYATERGETGEGADLKAAVRKIAAALKKGDQEGAEALAKATAKKVEEVGEVMAMFKPRAKKGLGFGEKGSGPKDGIEKKLQEIGRDAPSGISKDAAAYEQMGYDTAALALLTEAFAPAKDEGKKTRKDWIRWSHDMRDGGLALAKAGKAQGSQDLKAAAVKVTASCNACHSEWR